MASGMAWIQLMNFLCIASSSVFVWWTKNEVIFPNRIAPKFCFDVLHSLLMVPFVLFWM